MRLLFTLFCLVFILKRYYIGSVALVQTSFRESIQREMVIDPLITNRNFVISSFFVVSRRPRTYMY